MESDSSARIEIPANFEDAPVDYLVQLIGELSLSSPASAADP